MKKQSLLLVLAAGLILTGCSKAETPVSSSIDSSIVSSIDETSSSSSEATSVTSIEESSSSEELSSVVVNEFFNQTNWTNQDYSDLTSIVGKTITSVPYINSYMYEVSEDEYYYNSAYIDGTTTKEEYTKYLATLQNTYTLNNTALDDAGDTWYQFDYDNDNKISLDVCGYVYEGDYYYSINLYVYSDSVDPDDDDDDDDTSADYILNYASMGSAIDAARTTSGTYPATEVTHTINGTTFVSSTGWGIADANYNAGYASLGAFQLKKSTAEVHNTTALTTSATTIGITLLSTYDFSLNYIPTVLGGDSASNVETEPTISHETDDEEDTGVKNGDYEINSYYVEYTFTEAVSYISIANTNNSAIYVQSIAINPNGSSSKEQATRNIPEDDGNGYKALGFTKATHPDITSVNEYPMPTTGTPKALVLPIEFSDITAASKGYTIDTLNKAFNGTTGDTDYYSVHDYFYTSSYGKLDIQFDVYQSWIPMSNTYDYYNNMSHKADLWGYTGDSSYATNEQYIMHEALTYLDKQGVDLSQYDSDKDGVIDSVVLIPVNAINTSDDASDEDLGWAWQYWNYLGDPSTSSSDGYDFYTYDGVSVNTYLWAPYQFLFQGLDASGYTTYNNTSAVNTYTFIHEFSHVLGADDYYDTAYIDHPLDGYDMQDQSRADHCAYTKMIYGWITNSRLITTRESVTLTLDEFETNGDTIIIANNYDEDAGVFQEYWVLEYYTNNGLNAGEDNGLFSKEGLVIYHINSPIVYDEENEYYTIANNNTNYAQGGSKDNLIELVTHNGEEYVYVVGETTIDSIKDSNGLTIPYVVSVDKAEDGKLTLTFTYAIEEEATPEAE